MLKGQMGDREGGGGGGRGKRRRRVGEERSRIKGYMQVTMGGHMVISEGLMGITQAV